MHDTLTKRQKQILDFIELSFEQHGFGPTLREIADEFGFASVNGAVGHVKALANKGFLVRNAFKMRAIELSDEYLGQTQGLPVAGRVAAGMMTEAVEQNERIDFAEMFGRKNTFVLEVSGDSMIEANIADGDYVVVEPRRTAARGDIVVAQTDEGDATVKYYFPEKKRIRLQPANAAMKPIFCRDIKIKGIVVGVVRKY